MINSINHNLNSLISLINQLSTNEYDYRSAYLSNASIGGHTRHIIEILECLLNGYEVGLVDYVNRKRNLEIETSKELALEKLNILISGLNLPDKPLQLISEEEDIACGTVNSTYLREVLYNVEHITHHLALIKVTLIELQLDIVDENFGYAYSTLKYKNSLKPLSV